MIVRAVAGFCLSQSGRAMRLRMWLGSHVLQECRQLADVLDEQRAFRVHLPGPQTVRADESRAHAVGERPGDIAGEVVADEQHLVRGCFGCGED